MKNPFDWFKPKKQIKDYLAVKVFKAFLERWDATLYVILVAALCFAVYNAGKWKDTASFALGANAAYQKMLKTCIEGKCPVECSGDNGDGQYNGDSE